VPCACQILSRVNTDHASAGAGSNGGNGGDGANIRIRVDADDTHLLLATSLDVRGGKGGAAGEHGEPGKDYLPDVRRVLHTSKDQEAKVAKGATNSSGKRCLPLKEDHG